jgi:hypothetical protein
MLILNKGSLSDKVKILGHLLVVIWSILALFSQNGAAFEVSIAQLWEAFARRHYVDIQFGDGGRYLDRKGWKINLGQRAPDSLVAVGGVRLSDKMLDTIREVFSGRSVPNGIRIPSDRYIAWKTTAGKYLVRFCESTTSSRSETYEIWDEHLKKTVKVPVYKHFVQVVLWVDDSRTVIIQEEIKFDADTEIYGCQWWPHDIVDIDHDGRPEVVLLKRGYEAEELHIFTIQNNNSVIHRWSGLGYGL